MNCRFRVYGVPAPGGSKKGFFNKKTGRVVIVEDARRNKTWRESVMQAALEALPSSPLVGPLWVMCVFIMPRPKGHFGTGRNSEKLKDSAPTWHSSKPDATKLWRSTEDAMTGVAWGDDAQVVKQTILKRYAHPGERPGAMIEVGVDLS